MSASLGFIGGGTMGRPTAAIFSVLVASESRTAAAASLRASLHDWDHSAMIRALVVMASFEVCGS